MLTNNLFLILTLMLGRPNVNLAVKDENEGTPYGADCSFPIHYNELRCGTLLGDRQKVYDDFMTGCRETYGAAHCDDYERERIKMSLRQPQSMVNYTSTGFKKIKAPEKLWKLISNHWELNKDKKKLEYWPKGNVYTNHWASPTYMVSIEDQELEGAGFELKNAIWDGVQEAIEDWTQMEQKPSSMYGVRVYTDKSMLNPHVDRLPLVSSCIINVAQDVDEDWVLEVYDRAGNAVNVTMEPGDMVLYESGSLIHGRPFAMKGRYYANIFIHFEPTGRPLNYDGDDFVDMAVDNSIPPYILPNSPEVAEWKRRNPSGWQQVSPSAAQVDTSRSHSAAAYNDVEELAKLAAESKRMLFSNDRNGWQPIHEAARGGHVDAVEFLVKNGADVNARTHAGLGVTPLNIAVNAHSTDHPVSEYLKKLGAVNLGAVNPEL